MPKKILVINPGSTSTKIAYFVGETEKFSRNISHPTEIIQQYDQIIDQVDFRRQVILEILKEENLNGDSLDAISARGGLLRPIPGGTYLVNDDMLKDLRKGIQGEHASNLGGIIAAELAREFDCPAYIVDPVIVDELSDLARISGLPEIERRSIFHALNHKAVADEVAREQGLNSKNLNIIVAHMGGGVSVGLHYKGRVIDVNNALDGEGPFSPERSGSLPVGDLVEMCFSGKYSLAEIKKKIKGEGGLVAYLASSDLREIEKKIAAGDEFAQEVFAAMAYQISKEIGSLAPIVNGKIDLIILTGGMANSAALVELVRERVSFIAPVKVKAGEMEMIALMRGAGRVLKGEEEPVIYKAM